MEGNRWRARPERLYCRGGRQRQANSCRRKNSLGSINILLRVLQKLYNCPPGPVRAERGWGIVNTGSSVETAKNSPPGRSRCALNWVCEAVGYLAAAILLVLWC